MDQLQKNSKLRELPLRQDRRRSSQYAYLDYCVSHVVRVFLWDDLGRKYEGHVLSHDRNTILFLPVSKTPRPPFLLYKSAIQIITPAEEILFNVFSQETISRRGAGKVLKIKRKQLNAETIPPQNVTSV